MGIARSATRFKICSQSGRGRLEKRIFGNCIPSEDCLDKFLAGLTFLFRIGGHELLISRSQPGPSRRFRFHTPFRKRHESATHRYFPLLRYALYFQCQLRGNSDALADCAMSSPCWRLALRVHGAIIGYVHHTGADCDSLNRAVVESTEARSSADPMNGLGNRANLNGWAGSWESWGLAAPRLASYGMPWYKRCASRAPLHYW